MVKCDYKFWIIDDLNILLGELFKFLMGYSCVYFVIIDTSSWHMSTNQLEKYAS